MTSPGPDDRRFESTSVGERALIGRLDSEYGARLRAAMGWRLTGAVRNRMDADDVVQEALLRAMRIWPDERETRFELPPYSWVYRVALDCLFELRRHETRQKRNVEREQPIPDRSSLQFAAGLIGSSTGASDRLRREEAHTRILELIGEMSANDREVLFMRHVDGLTPAEIADVLDVPPQIIHSRYAKAMLRLRKLCQQHDLEPE